MFQANAIAPQIENIQTPRPMHDLPRNLYAMIHLRTAAGPVAIDARPSDAIALVRTCAPILAEEKVIDNAKSVDFADEKQDNDRLQQWLESLDSNREVQDVVVSSEK